ncbi:mitochondrial fission 1 protein [Linderina pennispora]|uniref:Mitochondrial fission 1 protein n=1 Tax=Linderina pennispora TaxID=61395 RepID=A0A1Y1WM93_9FUNG|nr:mitochondrial fission 1 protein [Linderina pennispora]ORX74687.1 mitochondrial fission 1 protein [Linderina pennispora]
MGKDLPYAIDVEVPITAGELQVLRRQYEREGSKVRVQTKFNYAWGLVKSSARHEQELGVQLLHEIHKEFPERKRECMYYLALGYYKMGEYGSARAFNEQLLALEPQNKQAMSLRSVIDHKVSQEGLLGMAMTGGVVALAGVVAAVLFKRAK